MALTDEERKHRRPKRGKKIICERQERLMSGQAVEPQSFLNDTTLSNESLGDISRRPPTREEMMARVRQNQAERDAEYRSMGRTGREVLGDLPPIGYQFAARPETDSEAEESDKENESANQSMGMAEKEDGMEIEGEAEDREEEVVEKEADETTPIAQQRSTGVAGPSTSSSTPINAPPIPSTPPARPNSGFKKPNLPGARGPPRHSTPMAHIRPRESFGAAFNNISIIANTSIGAPQHSTTNDSVKTRKESTESTGSRGAPILHVDSVLEEVVEHRYDVAAANGTYSVEQREDEPVPEQNGTYVVEEAEEGGEGEEEVVEEEQEVRVHVQAVVMRRSSVRAPSRGASMGGQEERVDVVELGMRRQSMRGRQSIPRAPSVPIQDVTMASIDEGERSGRRDEDDEEEEVEDEEMASVIHTPVRAQPTRPAKRPSLEHALHADSSPMAQVMARRSSGLRETMVRPKVSIATTGGGRKLSTDSVTSSIPFEDLSLANRSALSSTSSFEEAKTPDRTPRTNRLLRASIAARDHRQSQQQRVLPILEEAEAQGGERSDMEEEDEEGGGDESMGEMMDQRRGNGIPTTPVNRVPRLSQKLQSSVDRLSQPRHRNDAARPCARMLSPARAAPVQRAGRAPQPPSPSPARRFHSSLMNQTRGTMSGYTPNHRIDTTLMEDDGGNAKSGLAPRIKRIPRRDEGGGGRKMGPAVLNMSEEPSDVEEMRRVMAKNPTGLGPAIGGDIQSKNTSPISQTIASTTPITSPLVVRRRDKGEERREREEREEEHRPPPVGNHSFHDDFYDDMGGGMDDDEKGEERDDGREDEDDEVFDYYNISNHKEGPFARPTLPHPALPPTPNGRRSGAANGTGGRRSTRPTDSDADIDTLSSRASEISIGETRRRKRNDDDFINPNVQRGAAHVAAVAAEMRDDQRRRSFDPFDSPFAAPAPPRGRPTPGKKTPFRDSIARNADLYSTDTPGIDRSIRFNMDTEEEEEWAANQDSRQWRGSQDTGEDENEADPTEDSQIEIVEEREEDVKERVLAPRKLIAPTGTPGVRRSTRTRMKPVRAWLGEKAEYERSPTTGARRLVGVNEVVVRDKLFVKTGTADIQAAVLANKKTAKQRQIANAKRKERKRKAAEEEEENEEEDDE